MIPFADLWPIMLGWAIAVGSPGPSVMATIGASMGGGRTKGIALALGVLTGSLTWAIIAAVGLGAAMVTHVWIVEVLRYVGASYLLYLAFRSLRSALSSSQNQIQARNDTIARAWSRGFVMHLMNPKAAFFWGSLFAVVVPPGAPFAAVIEVGAACFLTSSAVMLAIAFIFSSKPIAQTYLASHRLFDGAFAVFFGFAGFKVLTSKLV